MRYINYTLFILFFSFIKIQAQATWLPNVGCSGLGGDIEIAKIFINSCCEEEGFNEFIYLKTGNSPLPWDGMQITGSGLNYTGTPNSGAPYNHPVANVFTSNTSIIATLNGGVNNCPANNTFVIAPNPIPPNSIVLITMSSLGLSISPGPNCAPQLANMCGRGPVFVLSGNYTSTTPGGNGNFGFFKNSNCANVPTLGNVCTTSVKFDFFDSNTGAIVCTKEVTYNLNNTQNQDGEAILANGTMAVGGCYEIPPCIAPPPPTLTPINLNMCKGQAGPANNQGMACSNCNTYQNIGKYNVYTAPTGGQPVFIGANFPVGFNLSTLPAGTTTFYAEQTGFCPSARIPITINVSDGLAVSAVKTDVNCNGGSTGTATATGSGGVAAYTYQWSSGANAANATNLAAGTYTVTITDNYGCKSTNNITVGEPPLLTTSVGATLGATCVNPGTAAMSAAGGTPPYAYQWSSGGSTTTTVTGQPGNYTVTVTDNKGCTKTQQVTIPANNTLPTAVANAPNTLTCNNTTVSINGNGSSSGANFTYNWSGTGLVSGGATLTPTVNQPGAYTITVTDTQNGCTKTAIVTVNQNIIPPVANAGNDKTLNCANNQQVTLNGTSNVTGSTYLWSTGSTSANPNVTAVGTYTVTVTSPTNGCTSTDQVVVDLDITPPVVSPIAPVTVTCNNPSPILSVSSTGTGLTYNWSPSGSGANTNVSSAGTYTVTVTAGNGCTGVQSTSVAIDNVLPTAVLAQPPVLTCAAGATSVSLDPTGSSTGPNIVYGWSGPTGLLGNSLIPPVITLPGTYILAVVNTANGCIKTTSVSVQGNVTPPTGDAGLPQVLNCYNNGSVTIGNAGSGNQNYVWSNGSFAPTQTINMTGTYTVTITNNTNGCTKVSSVIITEDNIAPVISPIPPVTVNCFTPTPQLNVSASGSNLTYTWSPSGSGANPTITMGGTYTVTVTNSVNGCKDIETVIVPEDKNFPLAVLAPPATLNCFNNSNIVLDPTGTSTGANFTYNWSGPNGFTGNTLVPPSVTTGGTYTLTVTDNINGCTKTVAQTVVQNTTLPMALAGNPQTLNCYNNGSVTIGGASSTGSNFTYNWSNGQTSATQNVILPGTYTITVTDTQNGCTKESSVVIDEDKVIPTVDAGIDLFINCYTPTQTIAATANAGTAPTYAWSGPGITGGGTTLTPTINLPGNYILTVTNSINGCTKIDDITVTADLNLPTAVASVSNGIDCNNATATLNAAGSSTGANITYNWSGPNGFTANTIDPTITTGGNYTVTVTNTTNGCTKTASIVVTEDKTAPAANAGATTSVTCSNPTIQLSATGSTGANFTYNWSAAGGGNITGGSTSLTPTINQAGTYTLTVTNTTTGCTNVSTVTVNEDKIFPVANATGSGVVTCFNPTLNLGVNVTSGSNLQFQWSASAGGNIVGNANQQNITVNQGGTYNVTITNATNGCSITSSTTTTSDNMNPIANATASGTIDCNNLNATLDGATSSQGAIYTYNWTGPNGFNNNSTYTPSVTVGGAYTISITNTVNGCTASKTIVVNEDKNPPAAALITPGSINCTNPTVTIQSTGSSSYLYSWSASNGGVINGSSSNSNVVASSAGTYNLNVINPQNGCQASFSTSIVEDKNIPQAVIAAAAPLTCSDPNITLNAGASTTGSTIVYMWNGPFNGIVGGLGTAYPTIGLVGTYTLVVQNSANGCSSTASVTVQDQKVYPFATAFPTANVNCTNPTVLLNGLGSSYGNNINYTWTTIGGNFVSGQNTLEPIVSKGGTYTLVVTNTSNNCSATKTITVDEDKQLPNANAGADKLITCVSNSVKLDGSASSIGNQYLYQWSNTGGNVPFSNGGNNLTPTVTQLGVYTLVVTNWSNGCTASAQTNVTLDLGVPTANAGTKKEISCNVASVQLDGTGSTSGTGLTFNWTTVGGAFVSGQTTLTPTVNQPGLYKLEVINTVNGCKGNAQVQVEDNRVKPILKVAKPTLLSCATISTTLNGTGSSTGTDFTYNWTTANGNITAGATTLIVNIDKGGIYNFKIKNTQNGCEKDSTITVLENFNKPIPLIAAPTLLTCVQPTQILDASASTKTQNAKITWITSTPNSIVSGGNTLKPNINEEGKYKLILTDTLSNCKDSIEIEVKKDANIPQANAGPKGELNCTIKEITLAGTASANATITYNWTTVGGNFVSGQTTLTPKINAAGKYTLKVFDSANQCLKESTVEITQDTLKPSIIFAKPKILDCKNAVMPLDASASSSGANFKFDWTTPANAVVSGATSLSPLINKPGTYTLTITNSTSTCSATKSINVTQDIVKPQANVANNDTLNCRNAVVKLTGTASANSGFYTFEWKEPIANAITKDKTLLTPTVSEPGNYQLVVTDTVNHCATTAQLTVIKNVQTPIVDAGNGGNLTCTIKNITLSGTATNGLPNDLIYSWTTPNGNVAGVSNALSAVADSEGKYFLNVENKINGCKAIDSTIVTQDASVPKVQIITSSDLNCKIKTLVLDGSGSSQGNGITFNWTTKNGGNFVKDQNTLTPTINSAGTYILQINNTLNNCIKEIEKTIKIDTLKPKINVSQDILTCAKPIIELNAKVFTTGNYTFEWLTSTGGIVSKKDTLQILIDKKGIYTLKAKSAENECEGEKEVNVLEDKVAPTTDCGLPLEINCKDSVLILQGDKSSKGPDFVYTWTTKGGNILENEKTLNPKIDAAGNYILSIFNKSNGCSNKDSVAIKINKALPKIVIAKPDTLTCKKQKLNVSSTVTTTGIANYTWLASANGNILADKNKANIEVDRPGIYSITVVDEKNYCVSKSNTTVYQDTIQPTASAGTNIELSCTSPTIDIQGVGTGKQALAYLWTTSNGTIVKDADKAKVTVQSAGFYKLLVTNKFNGCAASDDMEVTFLGAPKAVINPTLVLTCARTSVELDGKGSDEGSNIVYTWSDANGAALGSNLMTSATKPGLYNFKVFNKNNNCEKKQQITVTQDIVNPDADAGSNGTISCDKGFIILDAQKSSLGAKYTYLWSGGLIESGENTINPKVTAQAVYTLLVTNTENGCVASDTVSILSLKPAILASVANDPLCNNGKGSLKITTISGGTPPYMYSIDNGKNFYPYNEFTGLNPNEYLVKIKDSKNCQDQGSIIINNPPKLTLNINPSVKIKIGEDVQFIATAYPTTPPLKTIVWSPDSMLSCKNCLNPSIKAPLKNIYFTLKVVSENGCVAETFTNLEIDKEIGVYVPTAFSPNGDTNNDKFLVFGKPELVLRIKWMRIFDRWGDIVYSDTDLKVNDTNRGWDGTFNGGEVNPGVFIWNCEVEFIDGTSKILKGDVTLQK